jgi:acyl-CoA synthetase (AMP-forming)/AMP-acid ligase II
MNVENLRIPDLVKHHANNTPDKIAIEDEGLHISYAELNALREKAAKAFLSLGIGKGDRVAVWAPNTNEWILATIGLQSIGAVLVPVNTRMKGSEAAYVLNTSRAKVLCTVSGFLGFDYPDMLKDQSLPDLENIVLLKGEAGANLSWDAFLEKGEAVSNETLEDIEKQLTASDLADLIFTSGTTGNPKGVMCSHEQNLKVFSVWGDVVGLNESDRYLIVNPFFHTFGYKAGWMACLIQGACILPHAVFDAAEVMERVAKDRVSVLPGPPTLYQTILAHPNFKDFDLSCLRLAVTGAAAIPVSLIHQMRDELHFDTVLTAYGLTESCGVATMCRQGDDAEVIATTSGRAIPDVEVRCVDADNKEVARGEAGEIVVRGYNVMSGYFENETETQKAIDSEGWLHTGDVGIMDEQGNIRITDRIKDMFIVGGFNCYPAEIENQLVSHEAVAQAAVIGIADERMGEVAMACVVKAADAQIDEEGLINWCRDNMANYKVPRKVAFLDALPLNATGKVQKFVLREKFGG